MFSEEKKNHFQDDQLLYKKYFKEIESFKSYVFNGSIGLYNNSFDYCEVDLIKIKELVHSSLMPQFDEFFNNNITDLQIFFEKLGVYCNSIQQNRLAEKK